MKSAVEHSCGLADSAGDTIQIPYIMRMYPHPRPTALPRSVTHPPTRCFAGPSYTADQRQSFWSVQPWMVFGKG